MVGSESLLVTKLQDNQSSLSKFDFFSSLGKADNELTAQMIRESYPNYTVTWSDDGY